MLILVSLVGFLTTKGTMDLTKVTKQKSKCLFLKNTRIIMNKKEIIKKAEDFAREKMKNYDWPGNVRELRNVIERAVLLQEGPEIRPSEFLGSSALPPRPASSHSKKETVAGPSTLDHMEREHIRSALSEHGGNYSRTARAIGISLSTLKRKIKKYGLL